MPADTWVGVWPGREHVDVGAAGEPVAAVCDEIRRVCREVAVSQRDVALIVTDGDLKDPACVHVSEPHVSVSARQP